MFRKFLLFARGSTHFTDELLDLHKSNADSGGKQVSGLCCGLLVSQGIMRHQGPNALTTVKDQAQPHVL